MSGGTGWPFQITVCLLNQSSMYAPLEKNHLSGASQGSDLISRPPSLPYSMRQGDNEPWLKRAAISGEYTIPFV